MTRHFAGGCVPGHRERKHVLIRDPFPRETRVRPEAEATVERRIPDQDAPGSLLGAQCAASTLSSAM